MVVEYIASGTHEDGLKSDGDSKENYRSFKVQELLLSWYNLFFYS